MTTPRNNRFTDYISMSAPQRYPPVALIWLCVTALGITVCWIGSYLTLARAVAPDLAASSALILFLILKPSPKLRWIPLSVVLGSELVIRYALGDAFIDLCIVSLQTSVQAILAGLIIHHAEPLSHPQAHLRNSVRGLCAVLISTLVATLVGHSIRSSMLGLGFDTLAWQLEYLRSTLYILIIVPLLLAWGPTPPFRSTPQRYTEAGVLTFVWIGFMSLSYRSAPTSQVTILCLLTLLSLWTASRCSLRWTTLANVALVYIFLQDNLSTVSHIVQSTYYEACLWILVLASLGLVILLKERSRILRKNRSIEARLWAVMAAVPENILQVDHQGYCLDHIGIATQESPPAPPIPIDAFLPPDAARTIKDMVREVINTRTSLGCRIGHPIDKHTKEFEARVTPVEHLDAQPSAMVYIREITTPQVQQIEGSSSEQVSALQNLTGGIAHDFNNLLTTIIGNLDLLQSEAPTGDYQAYIADAMRAAHRGRELTHSLLAYSESQQLQPKTLDLARFLPQLLPRFQLGIRSQIALKTDLIRENTWLVWVDPDRLASTLNHLITNARDASGQQGSVTIRIERRSMKKGPHSGQDFIHLQIEDHGEGMSLQTLKRACDPFFTTRGVGRTGLGLSVARGFARQSGGDLQLHSEAGLGTRVSLLLPLVEGDDQPAEPGCLVTSPQCVEISCIVQSTALPTTKDQIPL